MNAVISTDIFCDLCGMWDQGVTVCTNAAKVGRARKKAKEEGWIYRRGEDGTMIDICPRCQQDMAESG